MTKNNPFLHTFLPAADRIIETSFQTKAQTDALLTTLALLRYKADKGRFPHELGELISTGYLKNLPMDPYGKNEMVYKITGNDFLLYSLGADFRDEGGVPSNWGTGKEGGDQVFWPLQSQ
jgi:hypothetical protein